MVVELVAMVAGLALLMGGAEALIHGASKLALKLGVRPGVVGLTVVAWGTSFPELMVSLDAASRGMPDMAMGNVVGSNMFNMVLVLGLAAIIRPLAVTRDALKLDVPVMIAAVVGLFVVAYDGQLGRFDAAVFVAALLGFTALLFRQSGEAPSEEDMPARPQGPLGYAAAIAAAGGGMLALAGGAQLFTGGAIAVAEAFGVSSRIIGLTLVAFGTSLPELVTTVLAAWRGKCELAVSSVVGSNILNVLGILGTTALVQPVAIDPSLIAWDVPVMIGVTLLLAVLLTTGRRLDRFEGLTLLGVGTAYATSLV